MGKKFSKASLSQFLYTNQSGYKSMNGSLARPCSQITSPVRLSTTTSPFGSTVNFHKNQNAYSAIKFSNGNYQVQGGTTAKNTSAAATTGKSKVST
jgi:hypothetical protein